MERYLRRGLVSSIDYENGMLSVTYPQYDDATTAKLPVFSFTDEYKMPRIGDEVDVLHAPSGEAAGVVLGGHWNKKNHCPHMREGIWRKELAPSDAFGKCWMEYDDDSGALSITAPDTLKLTVGDFSITLTAAGLLSLITAATTNTGIYTTDADVVAQGKSLASHTHPGAHGETGAPS